jgi:hypothetical protein
MDAVLLFVMRWVQPQLAAGWGGFDMPLETLGILILALVY